MDRAWKSLYPRFGDSGAVDLLSKNAGVGVEGSRFGGFLSKGKSNECFIRIATT